MLKIGQEVKLTVRQVAWVERMKIPGESFNNVIIGTVTDFPEEFPGYVEIFTGYNKFQPEASGHSLVVIGSILECEDVTTHKLTYPEPLTDRVWFVPSQSSPNTKYEVRFVSGRWSCTCPGYKFHGRCKHIKEKKDELFNS